MNEKVILYIIGSLILGIGIGVGTTKIILQTNGIQTNLTCTSKSRTPQERIYKPPLKGNSQPTGITPSPTTNNLSNSGPMTNSPVPVNPTESMPTIITKKYLLIEPSSNKKFIFTINFNSTPSHKYLSQNKIQLNIGHNTEMQIQLLSEVYPKTLSLTNMQLKHQYWDTIYIVKDNNSYFYTNKRPQKKMACHIMDDMVNPPCGYNAIINTSDNLPKNLVVLCKSTSGTANPDLSLCNQLFQQLSISLAK